MDARQVFLQNSAPVSHGELPSHLVDGDDAIRRYREVLAIFEKKRLEDVEIIFRDTVNYPEGLRDAKNQVHLLYCRGNAALLEHPRRIAVVGSRLASEDGIKRARKLARLLVEDGAVVVSGLARGIDTAAHTAAIEYGGQTIAVIGTPITEVYPKENGWLQDKIAKDFLLVSQVPIIRYLHQGPSVNRFFFPERNVTMFALTHATVIVEAGETSGSLIQARAALAQNRKLFILESCFHRGLRWPETLAQKGAIRVRDYADIKSVFDA